MLLSDLNLAEGFSKCKSGDEMYNFCLNIKDGYTRDEWENFIRVIYSLILNKDNNKIKLRKHLDEVCGGTMNNSISKKFLSCSLALLGVLPSPGLGSVKASQKVYSSSKENVSKKSDSSILPLIFKSVLAGTVGGAIVAYLYGESSNNSKPSNSLGITNLKYTCYMNSAIQQLYSLDHFRESVMNDNSGDPQVNAIKYLFSIISGREPENIDKLREAATTLGYKGNQEDCGEFIQSLGTVFENYGMELCVSNPSSFGTDLGKVSLQDILEHGGGLSPRLGREFLRKKLNKGPEFSDEYISGRFNELTEEENFKCGEPLNVKPVDGQFGILINRTDYLQSSASKSTAPIVVSDTVKKDGREYVLTGTVVHIGLSCNSGHYISYKKDINGKWYMYNDSIVSPVSYQEVKSESSTEGVLFIFTDVSKL